MIGARVGAEVGANVGARIGVGEYAAGGNPLAGVTRDAASGWYLPANAAEWAILLGVAGIASGNPSSTRNCQEAAGALADSIGAVALAQSGAGHLYQQNVTGFTRKAVQTVEGTAGQKWINSVAAPDPSVVSTLFLAVIGFPAANPAVARCLMANGGTLDVRLSTAGRLTIINGASTTGASTYTGTGVQLVLVQRNITASTFTAWTGLEKIVGTFGAVVSNQMFVLGGQTTVAGNIQYPYESEFAGAAAEITSAQAKSLIATITGVTPPWAP